MKSVVVKFPGSNRDRDMIAALTLITGHAPLLAWHTDTELPEADLIVIPGGFSHGDYLRSGAIAARAPVMEAVTAHAAQGVRVLGVCNGFQTLTEAGLLPGALMRNAGLTFVCKEVELQAINTENAFTSRYEANEIIRCPVAHHDGNYFADDATLNKLEKEGRVLFKYVGNPNGSARDIAGICNEQGNVFGMMPHPERAADLDLGNTDGLKIFESMLGLINA